jgi:hypothetical protein
VSRVRIEDMASLPGETWDELRARWREQNRGKAGRPSFRFSQALKGGEYREDLARFKGDPRAYISGPMALKKRVDELKREGYVEGPSFADVASAMDAAERKQTTGGTVGGLEGEALVKQCFEEARAEGFRLDEDDSS